MPYLSGSSIARERASFSLISRGEGATAGVTCKCRAVSGFHDVTMEFKLPLCARHRTAAGE